MSSNNRIEKCVPEPSHYSQHTHLKHKYSQSLKHVFIKNNPTLPLILLPYFLFHTSKKRHCFKDKTQLSQLTAVPTTGRRGKPVSEKWQGMNQWN
jgi:hypothetical protein